MAIIPPTLGVDIRAALVDNTGQAFTSGSPLPVAVISGGGGSQTDASAWTTGVTSFAPGGGVFNDSATDLTSGQQGTLRLTAKRAQHVNIRSAAGVEITSFGLSAVDKAGFTEGTSLMTPAGGVFNDTISADPTEDQTAALRITAKRGLHANLRNVAGAEIGIAAAPLIAAGAKTTNAAVPGATNIGTLPALANAVAPTLTETFQAALSVDLGGSLRVVVPGAVDTELPAAAALGDSVANPTTPMIGAANMLWVSGATQWIRQGVASQVGDSATGGSSPSVMLYGFNGTTFSRLRVDPTNFNLLSMAQGAGAAGVAIAGNPLLMGGSDGTLARALLTDTSGRQIIVGAAAANAVLAGNPLRLGASDGTNIQDLQVDSTSNKNLRVAIAVGSAVISGGTPGDAQAGAAGFNVVPMPLLFNGTNYDRARNNTETVIQASTSTAAGTVNTDVTNYNGKVLTVRAHVGSYGAAGSLLIKVQRKDLAGNFTDIPGATTGTLLVGADITLMVGPNTWPASTTTEFYANWTLARTFRIVTTVGVNNVTFSEDYTLNV